MIGKQTKTNTWARIGYTLLFFLLVGLQNPLLAQNACGIEIEAVTVDCNYANAQNSFTATVEVSWSAGTTGALNVSLGGQTQTVQLPGTSGSTILSGYTLQAPGFGYAVVAALQDGTCQAFSQADAIACTPACPDQPDAIGGFIYRDANYNGSFDGESGQANVLVEAYDCNGDLAGSAYSNADGLWSVIGLEAGADYRLEFSAQGDLGPSFFGPQQAGDVQFSTAGDCSVMAGFTPRITEEDCVNPDNVADVCVENFRILDWSVFDPGTLPFPVAPYVQNIGGDNIYWSRSSDDATDYTHRVFHDMLGGSEGYYFLEMDADNTDGTGARDVGVVFSLDRPVQRLNFELLDIDISGDAIDRVSVQGYLGGMPVALGDGDVQLGAAVNQINPGVFEGTTTVDGASTQGNVFIEFGQVVDQVAITFTASASAVSDPGLQAIGIGNISWCDGPAQVEPLCLRFLDWMQYADGDSNPMPYSIDGMELSMTVSDPSGIATDAGMAVDNDQTPMGGQRGFWPLIMNADSEGQFIENGFAFELPVEQLSFAVLGIDQAAGEYQDRVEVRAFLDGVEVPLTLSDVEAGAGVDDGQVSLMNANIYEAGDRSVNAVSEDGNVYVSIPGRVDSFYVRLTTGGDSPADPARQTVGISDLQFCICKPAPIQIGDYVWEDENGNGVQEACESPIADMAVQLFSAEGELLATTSTDANGRYHFTGEGTADENWLQPTQVRPGNDYFLLFGEDDDNPDNQFVQAGDKTYRMTAALQGDGNNPFMNDSNPSALTSDMPGAIPAGLPYIQLSTADAGVTNLTFDAGFQELFFDLSLSLALDSTLTDPPFLPGQEVTYVVTLRNEGLLAAEAIRFTNYKPQPLQLVDGGPYHQTASLYQVPALAPGDSVTTSITFRINANYPGGDLINAFEIVQYINEANYADQDSDADAINGNDPADEDDYAAVEIQVDAALLFDLSLKKEVVGQGPFEIGDQVTFEIIVTNEGILEGSDIQVRDIVPDGLSLNDPNWQMDNGQAILVEPIDVLASGASATRTITFNLTQSPAGGTIVNRAEILSFFNFPWTDDDDSSPNNDVPEEDDQDEAIINTISSFDLRLEKEVISFGPYTDGTTVSYEITVVNEGSITATDVQIVDYLPEGLSLNPNQNAWQEQPGNTAILANPIAAIEPGASASRVISFTVLPDVTGVNIVNWAEILDYNNDVDAEDTDSTPGNESENEDDDDSATITIVQSQPFLDLSLTKEVATAGPYFIDQIVTFNITVTNEGNVPAYNITVADHIPAGLELVDMSWMAFGNLAITPQGIDYLAPGESEILTIDFNISPAAPLGQIENYAEIYSMFGAGDDIDSSPGNGINNGEDDEDVAYLQVSGASNNFDLSLEKRVNTSLTPGPFAPGDTVTFELEVTNEGSIDAVDVLIGDLIPNGTTVADPNWVLSDIASNIYVMTQSINVAAGTSETVNITLVIDSGYDGNTLNNRAEIVRAENDMLLDDDDSTPANANTAEDDYDNELINIQQDLDLALSKSVLTAPPYEAGQLVTYELTVFNQGSITATDIQVFDYYPLQQLTLADQDWQSIGGNAVRLSTPIPTLAPGASVTVPITFLIDQIPCGSVITNCAEIGGTSNPQQDDDSVPANGSHTEDDDDAIDISTNCGSQTFDLSLEKTVSGGTTYTPGSNVTFDIEVTNEGDVTAQSIQIQDYIPAGLILIDPNWNGLGSVASLNTPIASLAPGASTTVSITFAIAPGLNSGALTNNAEVFSASNTLGLNDTDSTPGNGNAGPNEDDYDNATIYIQQQAFDLALSKSLKTSVTPGPFTPGSPVTFTISITNQGSVTAQNVQVREYFPAGLQINDSDWMAVGNVAELLLPIPSIAAGATVTVDVDFTVSPSFSGTSLTNFAEVGSAFNTIGLSDQDSTPGNGSLGSNEDDYDGATISVLQQNFDLALSKSVNTSLTPGPFTPGSSVTFVLSVTNQGDVTAQSIQLRDYIPLGLVLNDNDWVQNGSTAIYNNAITNLQPGATASVNITFTVAQAFQGGTIQNNAEVGAATNSFGFPDSDSTPANGSAGPNEDDYDSASINVILAQNFDLALNKTVNTSLTPGPFSPGDLVTFTLTVTNQGNVTAQNIELRDYIPLGLILMDNNWNAAGTTAILGNPIVSLAAGASASRNITFEISPAFTGSVINNFGEIGAASNNLGLPDDDSTPANGSAGPNEDDFDNATINVVPVQSNDGFDLALHKSVSNAGPYQPGDLVTFDITITNEGDVTATGIQVRDYIPQGMLLADLDWSPAGGTAILSAPIASLAPNASVTVSIDLVIDPTFQGSSITNNAEIMAASNGQGLADEDSTPDNGFLGALEDDLDDATITVSQDDFDLALSKNVATAGPFAPGTPVSFQITVTNQGSIEAQQVQVQDFIPNGLVLNDDNWTQNGNIATLDNPIASIAPGQTQSVTIDFVVDPMFQSTAIVNFAEIQSAINTQGLADSDSTPGNGSNGGNEDDYDEAVLSVTQESTPGFDLALTKVVSTPAPYTAGDIVTYTITVINQGDFDAYNVDVTDYIPTGLNLQDGAWTMTGGNARRTIPGPITAGSSETLTITFEIDPAYAGSAITNFAEISFADDDQIVGNTPPTDIDSQYDAISTNDAGGAPDSPSDNATMGNGLGAPGSTMAVTDEDDHDPARILLDNCNGLFAGFDGDIKLCFSCDPAVAEIDLFGALGGNPSPGGVWVDNNNTGVNLMDPTQVDVANLPPGIYTFTYIVGGMGICPQDQAVVTLEIEDIAGFACNDQVNLNFGTGCLVTVTPDMILEGNDDCMDNLEVVLYGPGGVVLGNQIDGSVIGELIFAEVIDPFCGPICSGTVFVNDITSPGVICPTQTETFLCHDIDSILNNPASLAFTGEPVILDNCSEFSSYTFSDTEVTGLGNCAGQRIDRVFTVTDPAGNTTQCTQEIIIENPSLGDVIPPFATPSLPCDSSYAVDADGYPLPSVTGFPTIQGFYGTYVLDQSTCNLGATYEDTPFIDICGAMRKFVRTWTVIDWCAPAGNNILTLDQVIEISDSDGPVVTVPTGPLTFSTSAFACTASFNIPAASVTDNCSNWEVTRQIVTDDIVPQFNQFGQLIGFDTVEVVVTTVLPGQSPFVSGIPLGCHTFRYIATDDCGNETIADAPFCVEDQIEPTAVCDDDLNISLGGQGFARIFATDIDEGSNDNCALDTLLVRRLFTVSPFTCADTTDYFSEWGAFVDFSCCDVNQMVTIELKVIDEAGNENICWLEVLIEDKLNPYCFAPNDQNLSCGDLPAGFDATDTQQLQNLFGNATADDNCSNVSVQELPPIVNLDNCGGGTILRRFQSVDAQGNISTNTCDQLITISDDNNYVIRFPADVVSDCGMPTIDPLYVEGFGCDDLVINIESDTLIPTSNTQDQCYTVRRTYRVLNWCEYDGFSDPIVVGRNEDCDGEPGDEDVWVVRNSAGVFIDRDDNPNNFNPAFGTKGTSCDGNTNPSGYWRTSPSVGYWEYTQFIKVQDGIAPQVNFTQPDQFCSIDEMSCNASVQYPFTIVENCSPVDLVLTVELDAFSDGSIDFDVTPLVVGTYPNYTITGEYPIGNHQFVVTAQDGCGNNTTVEFLPFNVVDCLPPSFTCLSGVSFNIELLPPNTDIDGDGEIDAAGAGIWASDFHINDSDCSDDTISYSINLPGETPNINQTALYFTCDDVGLIDVEVYFWDSAFNPEAVQPDGTVGGPNWDFCQTTVFITDNNNLCNQPQPTPMMAGLVTRENDDAVEAVQVALSGQMSMSMMTGSNGTYQFDDLPMGADYTVTPSRNDDHRNGVSTFDLILIQQHLLGMTPFTSPYKMIAADVNNSGSITTLDMIQIQQLILGTTIEFANNTSWRFVEEDFVFPVPTNPWFTTFPEAITINNLNNDIMSNDFVAIKIGDVNYSAQTTLFTDGTAVENRSFASTFHLQVEEQQLQAGQLIEVPFYMSPEEWALGYQFTLEFAADELRLADVGYGMADEYTLGLYDATEGMITASWYEQNWSEIPEEKSEMFRLVFEVQSAADGKKLSEMLDVSSRYTLAEAYGTDGSLLGVALEFVGDGLPVLVDAAPFELYQNRPNPFRESTIIGFELPEAGRAQLSIFDLSGRLLRTYEGEFAKGYHEYTLNRSELNQAGLSSGVLYYRLQMGERVASKKMILAR
jgi:uncharacterized repeat protein (TIGR01451 family)